MNKDPESTSGGTYWYLAILRDESRVLNTPSILRSMFFVEQEGWDINGEFPREHVNDCSVCTGFVGIILFL